MRGASHVIVRCVFRALCGASLWGPAAQVGDRELLKLRNGLAAVILDTGGKHIHSCTRGVDLREL